METNGHIKPNLHNESIDFNKLIMVVKKNLIWILIIFLLINSSTYLLLRYWPNQYESHSEIKLDIKNEASALGINALADDPNQNIISGEIELIRSRLFLNRVLDSIALDVSYFNKGDVLNFEFFGNTPFLVDYKIDNTALFNTPFFVDEKSNNAISIRLGEQGTLVNGRYGETIILPGIQLTLRKNPQFVRDNSELNCFFIINSRNVLLDYLLRNLEVIPLNFNANTIRISFRDYNQLKASTIVNKIDSLYLLYSNEQKNQANKQKIDWLASELRQIEEKMGEYENYFESFILKNKTNDLNEELKNTITLINALDSQRYLLTRKIAYLDQLTDDLNTGSFFIPVTQQQSLPKDAADNLAELQKLQQDLDRLKLSYSEATFAYKEREHAISALQVKLTEQFTELKSTWMKNLKDLNLRKNKLEQDFAGMPNLNTQFNKNQRFYQLYEQFYLSLMQSKSEFEIAKAGTTPDFKILSPASISWTPITPNKLMIQGIGFVASLMVCLLFIGILYLANNKITSLYELERYSSVPVLGVIPASSYFKENALHIVNHPKSMVSEAFRTLRTNLDFFNVSAMLRTIAVSSTVSGEGKSFVAMNLGSVIALSKKKVILLDLDMRKAKNNLFSPRKDSGMGVSTILIRKHNWQECVLKSDLEGFDYIPAGPQPPNPSELLLNGEFSGFLDELKKNYDYIILDTPPVGLVTDGVMAMKHADISIYIFRANYSKKEFLFNLKRIININKFSNITTLLNASPMANKTYGYGYYEESSKTKNLRSLFKR